MNPFHLPQTAPRIGTAVITALLLLPAIVSCGGKGTSEPLDRWHDGQRTVRTSAPVLRAGTRLLSAGDYENFRLTGEALTQPGAEAALLFHSDGESGYEVLLHNGPIDGTRKSGSLASVRNLYRSLAEDGEWFGFEIAVRGRNIAVRIDTTEVVRYTEPEHPYRTEAHARQRLGHGAIALCGIQGEVALRDLRIERLGKEARNEADTLPPVDERTDGVIRLQQRDFPVIDYHVHLKGGLTKELAHALSIDRKSVV